MANKIQFRRGVKANLPTLSVAEPAFTTDTNEFFIGNGSANVKLAKQSDLDSVNTSLSEKANIDSPSFTGVFKTAKNTLDDGSGNTSVAKDLNLSGGSVINTSNNEIQVRIDNSAAKQGFFANNNGAGFYDWKNSRAIMLYDTLNDSVSFNHGGKLYLNNYPILSALSGGGKIQSGTGSFTYGTANSQITTNITFPVAYSSTPLIICGYSGGLAASPSINVFTDNSSNVSATGAQINAIATVTGTVKFWWIAIGN
ncbi:hypothetical protein [Clostridium sp. BL-8]|uniref:hyaluronate lyase N-terminal domain-containing protein n=1 Tax=Clostridium sp. BL-8 TaxID=349938 RepID=UPI00098CA2C6|nr:hypothetical protein [Clostridium sp. BL-8]OOM76569.1 hypothetical protein CLOBL_34540 [Clostridium sp. BL-8]